MDKAKSSVLVLIVVVIVSLGLLGTSFVMLQKEKTNVQRLQEELDDVKTRQRITETKLDDSKKALADMEANLKAAQDQIASLSNEVTQERVAKEESLAKLDQMRSVLEQQKSLRADLEDKFTQSQEGAQKLQSQLSELDTKKKELEGRIKELEDKASQVELGKIVVAPDASKAAASTTKTKAKKQAVKKEAVKKQSVADKAANLSAQNIGVNAGVVTSAAVKDALAEGKVLVLNKEYDFAVINLGSKDGINAGDVFTVYHGSASIGDIKIEKVHESMSAAGFVTAGIKDKINEGDKVAKKSK
jgi:chromosome segregation ATPase